ncbi:MAG: precorrin-8X methylmutase [Angelakisella sp.]|jgi:precorrin-8X/cobalt-precorrin-8 methylmutase|nr:precorrin-8X methylmutase [Angelakisella sp.]
MEIQIIRPQEIEARSMAIIQEELERLGELPPADRLPVIKRVIHTTADFDYRENLWFSDGAVQAGIQALRDGAWVVTDTNMARAGVNRSALERHGGRALCFMAEEEIAQAAKERGETRAALSMEAAAALDTGGAPLILAVGNAPTALIRAVELMGEGKLSPALLVAAPVGFVNVLESKGMAEAAPCPRIIARGRKGGSTVAAAILNALLYQAQA